MGKGQTGSSRDHWGIQSLGGWEKFEEASQCCVYFCSFVSVQLSLSVHYGIMVENSCKNEKNKKRLLFNDNMIDPV